MAHKENHSSGQIACSLRFSLKNQVLFKGVRRGYFSFVGSVLNQSHERAVRIDKGTDATASRFDSGRIKPRLTFTSFRQRCGFAGRIERVEIVQPQTATEPTGQGI